MIKQFTIVSGVFCLNISYIFLNFQQHSGSVMWFLKHHQISDFICAVSLHSKTFLAYFHLPDVKILYEQTA